MFRKFNENDIMLMKEKDESLQEKLTTDSLWASFANKSPIELVINEFESLKAILDHLQAAEFSPEDVAMIKIDFLLRKR